MMSKKNEVNIRCERRKTITPKLAAEWLELNKGNRSIRPGHVKRLAHLMSEGEFLYNGDQIRFDDEGQLIDGQHRLMAVCASGATIESDVSHGWSSETFDTFDQAERRMFYDALSRRGEENSIVLASTVRMLYDYEENNMHSAGKLMNKDGMKTLDKHPKARDSVEFVTKALNGHKSVLSPSIAAAVHCMASDINKKKADEFFGKLLSGANITDGEPVHVLRIALEESRGRRRRIDRKSAAAITIKAFNASLRGEKISTIRFAGNERFPKVGEKKAVKANAEA